MSKLISRLVVIGGCAVSAVALGITIFMTINAKSIGEDIGNGMGKVAGLALGSFDGVTKGLGKGTDDGTSKGLSAEDTMARLANEMKKVGRLQVLNMNTTLTCHFSEGNYGTVDLPKGYHALLFWEGTVSYTVDLEQCSISIDDVVKVTIPHPELRITIDPEKTKKLAEENASLFSDGSTYGGYEGYINTLKQMKEKVSETIDGYEGMKATAENSALSAVERLVGGVRIDDKPVVVEFADDTEEIKITEKGVKS